MTALIGAEIEQAEEVAKEAAAGWRRLRRRQRQCARPGGDLRHHGRAGARRRHRQGQGHQARHAAGGFRAVPFAADAARGRRAWPRNWPRSPSARWPCRCWPMSPPGKPADPDHVRQLLVEQVTGRVRWRESILALARPDGGYHRGIRRQQGADRHGQAHRQGPCHYYPRYAGRPRSFRKDALMFDLTGKTALVTGASGGIGGAIAKALHAQGAKVVLSGTRAEALEAVRAELWACARLHRPRQSVRHRLGRSPAQGGGRSRGRRHRHPGQQCRHHQRQSLHAHEG